MWVRIRHRSALACREFTPDSPRLRRTQRKTARPRCDSRDRWAVIPSKAAGSSQGMKPNTAARNTPAKRCTGAAALRVPVVTYLAAMTRHADATRVATMKTRPMIAPTAWKVSGV